jgi:hypothetical protein
MGCASFTAFIVAMVQTPSDGTLQPIENSPPGIHTIPSGPFVGGGVLLGTVGAKVEAFVTGTTSSAATAGEDQPAFMANAARRQRLIWLAFIATNVLMVSVRSNFFCHFDGELAGCSRIGTSQRDLQPGC